MRSAGENSRCRAVLVAAWKRAGSSRVSIVAPSWREEPNSYSGTVLGFFWSATMNTSSLRRWSVLGFREVEWIAPGGS